MERHEIKRITEGKYKHQSLMPLWYSLMVKRTESDYVTIRIDQERATFNSIQKNFPSSEIIFCRVHIIRGWTRWMKHYFGVRFYKDEELNCFFKCLCGSTFLDLEDQDILHGFFRFLENFFDRLSTKKRKK